jgi:signal transduction histidine kinase
VRHETTGRRLLVNAAPIPGPGGPAGAVLVLREGAARPAERTRAERADEIEFWSELAGRMAHTLKNPLVSIKTFTQLLPERYDDVEFRKNFLGVVAAEADKINEVADRLLLYSAAHQLEPVPTDLRALVETVLNDAAPRCRRLGVQVERDLEELPVTMADPQRLSVALTSLVDNALDAMEEGGRLGASTRLVEAPATVSTGERFVVDFSSNAGPTGGGPPAFAAIEISDTGCGIPRERLAKVVQPFRSDKVRGVGLGLAIVAKVIEEHHGRMEITSTPGRGTRVRLLLPTAC